MSQPAPRRDFRVVDAVVVPRRSRLRTGFHRLGLVLALIIVVCSASMIILATIAGGRIGWADWVFTIIATAIGAMVAYWACRTLAWVIAGFLGD